MKNFHYNKYIKKNSIEMKAKDLYQVIIKIRQMYIRFIFLDNLKYYNINPVLGHQKKNLYNQI